jgi:hypothetical protein
MRQDRGNWWDERRIATARKLLASGVEREFVAQRLGISRTALKEAISRFNLEPPSAHEKAPDPKVEG